MKVDRFGKAHGVRIRLHHLHLNHVGRDHRDVRVHVSCLERSRHEQRVDADAPPHRHVHDHMLGDGAASAEEVRIKAVQKY